MFLCVFVFYYYAIDFNIYISWIYCEYFLPYAMLILFVTYIISSSSYFLHFVSRNKKLFSMLIKHTFDSFLKVFENFILIIFNLYLGLFILVFECTHVIR